MILQRGAAGTAHRTSCFMAHTSEAVSGLCLTSFAKTDQQGSNQKENKGDSYKEKICFHVTTITIV
jgi:hypothetical protein